MDSLAANMNGGNGVVQSLNLEGKTIAISEGNSISFENWDTNASDDFSGMYNDLQNKPELFSGQYADLQNKPDLYNKTEIDNLISGIEINGGVSQNLTLEQTTLSISGGNSISFENWDADASDDFSGVYDDLQNKPDLYQKTELYNKSEIDNLIAGIETNGSVSQNLNLDNTTLSISRGNSILFDKWDTNVDDDFDGKYSSLTGILKIYTQTEIDNLIK